MYSTHKAVNTSIKYVFGGNEDANTATVAYKGNGGGSGGGGGGGQNGGGSGGGGGGGGK